MSTSPVNSHEVIRFYERVNRLKPTSLGDRGQINSGHFIDISADAKRKIVLEMAFSEVLEKIRK
jgi:hypothetical protein